ncbi:hypothetical protein V6B16_13665 [Salinimicrobium catena]|uniref:hypothetical protein n=1 Tax=Salinimicrobium catena TaxID=390640 RepID=UPI002FE4B4C8
MTENIQNKGTLNLEEFLGNGTIFSGRPQGKKAREKFNLDKRDLGSEKSVVIIPEKTTSLNPSFMLGLFFQSYKKLKGNFSQKYEFKFLTNNINRKKILQKDIEDFYRQAELEVNPNNKSIFDYFR